MWSRIASRSSAVYRWRSWPGSNDANRARSATRRLKSGSAVAMWTKSRAGASSRENATDAPHSKKVIWSPGSSVNMNAVAVFASSTR